VLGTRGRPAPTSLATAPHGGDAERIVEVRARAVAVEARQVPDAFARIRALDHVAAGVEAIVVAAIVVNIVITFGNALIRFLFAQDLPWSADIWSVLLSIITFLGAPAYFRRTNGMAYTALVDALTGLRRQALQACSLLILLGVCAVALAPYPIFLASQSAQTLPILGISGGVVGIWLGIGLVLLSVFAIERLLTLSVKAILIGAIGPALIALGTLVVVLVALWLVRQVGHTAEA